MAFGDSPISQPEIAPSAEPTRTTGGRRSTARVYSSVWIGARVGSCHVRSRNAYRRSQSTQCPVCEPTTIDVASASVAHVRISPRRGGWSRRNAGRAARASQAWTPPASVA